MKCSLHDKIVQTFGNGVQEPARLTTLECDYRINTAFSSNTGTVSTTQEHQAMKMIFILTSLLMATLLVPGAARAAETTIQVERDQGTPVAQFKIGDAHCVLRNDQVHCTPVRR